jgi:dienelactone hydrolase
MTVVRILPKLSAIVVFLLALTACTAPVAPVFLAQPAAPTGTAPALPAAVEYDLGEAIIVQERFPEDSRFRNMPVRLNGVIAAPADGGPHPVVLILHGTHPGCPETEHGVDRWPCDPAVERANYRGFAYLAEALAAQGYVALAINTNAEDTFGFGEATPGERLEQLITLHLDALATAAAGGANDFGVELAGRADLSKLAIFGHSRGAERAVALARQWATDGATRSYGPADGVLLIAPAIAFVDPAGGVPVPMALINAACDGDVTDQTGQIFFEAARLAPAQRAWAASVWLERANHNYFNDTLPGDPFGAPGRPDCDPLLGGDAQRAFLVDYAGDFLTMVFSPDPAQVRAALERMGSDVAAPAMDELYGAAAQAAWLADVRHRLPLLTPAGADDFAASPVGGAVTAEGVTTFFCPDGYYTPTTHPELADCHRAQVTVPGQPAHAVVSWDEPGGALHFELPVGVDNLLLFDAISVRTGVDPLALLNVPGAPQAFSVQVTDRSGATASVAVRPDEPALRYPAGEIEPDDIFGELFTGRVPLLPVRVPISVFTGVNLASIAEVALVFDQTASGTLFLADVELVRAPVSPLPTLSDPPSPELIAAAEAGDVEAMRQLANLYAPTEALGVQYGNLERAVFWHRAACAAGYANAQVDFYEFARLQADLGNDAYLDEAVACLDDAIRQGHRSAIIDGAFRAAFIEQDYRTAFFLYALLEESDPDIAAQRFTFADQLTQAEIDEAEAAAAAWRAENEIKDYDDFFAAVDSPFRQVGR